MEVFIDSANVDEIREAVGWGVVSGVTTNPSLVSKEGRSFHEMLREICDLVSGPVSAEVISLETDGMVQEARQLSKIASNIVIKIPILPAGLAAVKQLTGEGIRTNVTLVFSALQALLAARAGSSFVSPFIGRIDDTGLDGTGVLSDIMQIYNNYQLGTKVIAASIRHPKHVLEAARIGADIATIPYKVLAQLFKNPLTDIGIQRFLEDWEKVKNI
jgi:transaldolase